MPKQNVRLPSHVTPQRYSLTIRPDLEAFTFLAEETIDINLLKADKKIALHSAEIEVLGAYWKSGKDKIDAVKISYNLKAEIVTLQFPKTLKKGKGKLHLDFRGVISEKLRGFYRAQYTHKGQVKHMATTQFESTDARRAFPCFDEPAHKAVFDLTMVVPESMTVISNTLETATPAGVEHDPGYKVVKFAPTPKMSTYLLAYIVGDFDFIETQTQGKNGTIIRVFTTPGKKNQAKFALDVAKRTLEFLNEYFAIPYPLPVLDMIAIPDFQSGAMENWGAVTFRETALLVDDEHTAFANRQSVAEVVAHELVHQWFGNLVTMEWWTHLWLNESFASFMAYIVMDELFPEWKVWTRFVMNDHTNALQLDSLQNTHPIEVEVHHPDQISEIFDAISYDKGASVLRMLKNYIGDEFFRDGLRYYLKKHSYKNTSSILLWEAFEKVSKKPIRKFMHAWVSQSGYPLIAINQPKTGKVQISQTHFSLDRKSHNKTWPVPLQFELQKDELSKLEVFGKKNGTFTIASNNDYVKANPDETGFYRTLYSPALLAKLYEPTKNKQLSVIDRYGIIRDLFAMAKSGHLSTAVYLEFLSAYKNEDSYIIWAEILSGMHEIYELCASDKKLREQLCGYYLRLLKEPVKLVGWTAVHKESQSRGLLRSIILHAYGSYGDSATVKQAQKIFKNRIKKAIPADLRSTVYGLVGREANSKDFTALISMYKSEELQEEQRRIGRAIMSVKNPNLFLKSLDFTMSKNTRSQDTPLMIALALMGSENKILAWKWIQKNWQTLFDRYAGGHLLVWIVKYLGTLNHKTAAKEISQFFKKHPVPSAARAVKQSLEQIGLAAAWYKRDHKEIRGALRALNRLQK